MYNLLLYQGFNTAFSTVPIIWFSCMDFQYSRERLLSEPELYKGGLYNIHFNFLTFLRWIVVAFTQAALLVVLALHEFGGLSAGYAADGDFVFGCIVVVANIKLLVSSY